MDIRTKLCYYDTRNPESGCFGMSEEEAEASGERTKASIEALGVECCCDNCYYGRTELAEYALKLELASFSN